MFGGPISSEPADQWRFFGRTAVGRLGDDWTTWIKPTGFKVFRFLVLGAGGGGGGGHTRTAGNAGGGGAGGSGSPMALATIPAWACPDVLYMFLPLGGPGGAASSNGTSGQPTNISIYPYPSGALTLNTFLTSAAGTADFGGGGGAGAAGTAGTTGGTASRATSPMIGVGQPEFVPGQNGVAGGSQAGAAGTSVAIPTTGIICTAGAGGAGTTSADFAGGGFTAVTGSILSDKRPIAPAAGSNDGAGGFNTFVPYGMPFFWGGCGGSSSNAGVGGRGGHGGFGAGGGGGGAGTTGGTGGNGGPGLVVITGW